MMSDEETKTKDMNKDNNKENIKDTVNDNIKDNINHAINKDTNPTTVKTPKLSILDRIPDSTWFFCFPMSLAVWCIVLLGVCHPFFWIKVWRVYRSELFIFMYVLVGFWSLLSCAMVYGIIAESVCIYVFWIWYTLVFCLVMAAMMFLLFCGFCVLGMRRKSVGALLGLLYYLVSLYFVVVVNKQRKEIFGTEAKCGSCFVESIERKAYELAPGLVANKHGITLTTDFIMPLDDTDTPTTPWPNATNVNISTFPAPTRTFPAPTRTFPAPSRTSPSLLRTSPPLDPTRTAEATEAQLLMDDDTLKLALRSLASFLTPHASTKPPPTRTWAGALFRREVTVNGTTPSTLSTLSTLSGLLDHQPGRGLSAIARLSELLLTSNECRKPRQPAHGQYAVSGNTTALRLSLRCDSGYVEDSKGTECKHNWWDRPLPQCRKKTPQQPTATGCTLPRHPAHGRYTVEACAGPRGGARAAFELLVLAVACDAPYRPVDASVVCVSGHWRHAPPDCQKHCQLSPQPSVEYKCLNAFKGTFSPCSNYTAGGVTVVPSCRPAHAHKGPFRYMRCRAGAWDHVLTCAPNANFTL